MNTAQVLYIIQNKRKYTRYVLPVMALIMVTVLLVSPVYAFVYGGFSSVLTLGQGTNTILSLGGVQNAYLYLDSAPPPTPLTPTEQSNQLAISIFPLLAIVIVILVIIKYAFNQENALSGLAQTVVLILLGLAVLSVIVMAVNGLV